MNEVNEEEFEKSFYMNYLKKYIGNMETETDFIDQNYKKL